MEKSSSFYESALTSKTFSIGDFYPRHKEVSPSSAFNYLTSERIVKSAKFVFTALTAFFAGGTLYSANYYRALPNEIIKSTTGCFALTVISALVSVYYFNKKTFWHDPQFKAEMSLKAAQDIQNNNLGYVSIQDKYGSDIKNYALLSEGDLKTLLRNQIMKLESYNDFLVNHGTDSLHLFDALLPKDHLKNLFLNYIEKLSFNSFNLSNFEKEIQAFGLPEDGILSLAMNAHIQGVLQGSLNYFNFRAKYSKLNLLNLDDLTIKLTSIFIFQMQLIKDHKGLIAFNEFYKEDISLLGLCQTQVNKIILSKEVENIKSYRDFKRRNGADSVQELLKINPDAKEKMKNLFFDCSFKEMTEDFFADTFHLGIKVKELYARVENDIRDLSYDEFVQKNSRGIFSKWRFIGDDQIIFASKFLEKIKTSNDSLNAVNTYYQAEIQSLSIQKEDLADIILPKELQRCWNSYADYREFESRNGENAYLHLLKMDNNEVDAYKKALCELFSNMHTKQIISEEYAAVATNIGFTGEELKRILEDDVKNLSYSEFIKKRGLIVLEKNLLISETRQKLSDKFEKYVQTCSLKEMNLLENDAKAWGIPLDYLFSKRWESKKMDVILKDELEAFKKVIKNPIFSAEKWARKALTDIKANTFNEIVNKYKLCIELGILSRDSIVGDGTLSEKVDLLIAEQNLEALFMQDEIVFKLLNVNSQNFKKLKKQYFKTKCLSTLNGQNNAFIEKLISTGVVSTHEKTLIDSYKRLFNDTQASFELQKNAISAQYQNIPRVSINQSYNLNISKADLSNSSIELEKAKTEHEIAIRNWKKILSDVEQLEAKIASAEKPEFRANTIQELQSDLDKALKDIDSEIEKIKNEELKPVSGFLNAMKDTQQADKSEKIKVLEENKALLRKEFETEKSNRENQNPSNLAKLKQDLGLKKQVLKKAEELKSRVQMHLKNCNDDFTRKQEAYKRENAQFGYQANYNDSINEGQKNSSLNALQQRYTNEVAGLQERFLFNFFGS